ncbi:MAG TPA: hypothetical protein PLW48_01530 [Alphaproteobacteria bacterium]|nr:hypothetical protein [Rhodospirillaceae bacterium]HRJ65793.1 hypothetical protein [Alphaproteobacteria bacterium]
MTSTLSTASPDAARISIDILMDLMSKPAWRTGDGRGPWLACLAAMVLALDPACKARRLLDSMTAVAGGDLTGLRGTMAQLGYFSETLDTSMRDIDGRLLPCLFIADARPDAPYVIFLQKDGDMTIYDSQRHDIRPLPRRDAEAALQGTACFFQSL